MEEIVQTLTPAQQKNLLELYDWCEKLERGGRGVRTGRFLEKKGLAYWTGEVCNYAAKYRITDKGKEIAVKLKMIKSEERRALLERMKEQSKERSGQGG